MTGVAEKGGRLRYWLLLPIAVTLTVLCATFLLFTQLLLVVLALGNQWPSRRFALTVARFWARSILSVSGVRVEVIGDGHVGRPVIFASNHQGVYDIFAMFVAVPEFFTFIAKRELFYVPFLGWHLWLAGYVLVDRARHSDALRSLERAGEKIRSGQSIVVFPEGTRSKDGSVLPFKKGSFQLALTAQVPIVPVAIEGSQWVMRKHELKIYPGTIRVAFGKPIEPSATRDRDALMRETRDQVVALHRSLLS